MRQNSRLKIKTTVIGHIFFEAFHYQTFNYYQIDGSNYALFEISTYYS